MNNVIDLIKKDLQRHMVKIILPGESEEKELYLTVVKACTSLLEDLKEVYKEQITPLHIKLAEKLFGTEESDHEYGLFIDKQLNLVFAFNRKFGDYDRNTKTVQYKELDEILLENIEPGDAKPVKPPRPPFKPPGNGGGIRVLYSLTEKEKK